MKNNITVTLMCFILTYSLSDAKNLPDTWKKCPKKADEECLKSAIQDAIVDLKDGNKGISVLPLDPLHIKRMEISQGGSSPVSINLTFYDIDLIGFSRSVIKSARIDWDKYDIEFDLDVDGPCSVLGDYSIEGKVLVLPIQGNGKANITLTGYKSKITLKGKENLKGGKKYFKVEEATFLINPDRVYIWLGNLFNGVPNLGDNMNKFLNDNWESIIDELKQTISAAMGEAVLQIANGFFKNVPVNELYAS